ncbi:MAG: TonB-dependent receptor, partial [Novosphingobium sp.]
AELSRQAKVSIGMQGGLPSHPTPAIHGEMTVQQALRLLLSGTGFVARRAGPTAWRIEQAPVIDHTRSAQQVAASSPLPAPQPIVVTASKRDMALTDLPLAISVALLPSGESGTRDDTNSIAQAVEGLALTGAGPGRNRIFLRGIADSAFNGESQSTVAIVLDDARLTYAAPDPDIRLVDMVRVEVLKGPQGSLYGTGALGGIYHLVSRRAQLDMLTASVSAGGSIVSSGAADYSVSAMANLPLVSDKLGLRLVGYAMREGGWIDTGDRSNSNSTRVSGLRGALGANVGEGWRLDLTGFAQWTESRDSSYSYAPHARTRPAQLPEPHDNDLRHLAARLSRESGGVDIVASTGMTWHEVNDTLDATIGADSFGLANPQTLTDERRFRVWDNELRFSRAHGRWRWLAGVTWLNARQHLVSDLESPQDALIIDDDRRTTNDLAVFGDITVPIAAQVALDVGARLFRSETVEQRMGRAVVQRLERVRTGLTPSFSISWRPDATSLAWIRYGSAFRSGGSGGASDGAIEMLKGDELVMIEAGWRTDQTGGLRLEVGTWYGWWENLQSDQLQTNGLIETRNAGNAFTAGAEVSATVPLASGWQFEGGANYTMAKLHRNELGFELDDSHLSGVPEYTFRARLGHDFMMAGAPTRISASLRYVGPSRLSFDPLVDRPMGKFLESRISANVKLRGFSISAGVTNLFGERDDTFAFGNSLRFATMRQYTPQDPTRYSLQIEKQF